MSLKVVLFDMDGTIWRSPVDWGRARREMGIPDDEYPIAAHLEKLPPAEREAKERILVRYEEEGVRRGEPIPGARELLEFLRKKGIKCVLVTNNSRRSAEEVLRRTGLRFDRVFTRNDSPLKPYPEALLRPLGIIGVCPRDAVLVGDSHHDFLAASRAGVEVILVSPSPRARSFIPPGARYHEARDLREVRHILERIITRDGKSSP